MNRRHQILFSGLLFVLTGLVCHAQEKSKTYKETFNVDEDAVININTSYADIEFETWNKNQVEITAVVELEGATDEEVKAYFEKDQITIKGNSKEIEVSTQGNTFWGGNSSFVYDFDVPVEIPNIEFVMPEIPEIPQIPEIIVIPNLPPMPPMPPMPHMDFDYDAYKKDGDKYLKEWKKNFDKNFDKEYKERFKEWSEEMGEMAKEMAENRKEMEENRKLLMEERKEMMEEQQEQRKEAREEMQKHREEARKHQEEVKRHVISINNGEPNVFYFSSDDGERKKYKVKKRIKIKMPKNVKLKMDVRHGEVKLAANTKNINASLSYASLHASTIDGDKTNIRASYSPVEVQQWNYGQLKTDYSDRVNLREVKDLKLNSVSSNVSIGKLMNNAFVTNSLGALNIDSVSSGFSNIDITVENGEVDCAVPSVPFTIYVNETASEFSYPKSMAIGTSKNYNTNVHKGYHIANTGGKSITINSKYSDVVLKE
ncbi:hypothetical protein J0X14_07045 [Muricauda sp. CAU 1633]|uniref:hypothetical protein n=1 Tax=Allomuricauda sp. CAU 1633 TaxID=2816036 RepID=UPI001A8EBF26|nr:hypothetical protein [Muricauda sp. CAU 1633]MBO0322047.1 hypothetical protein [Muricauda sp. CAU 1633]